MKVVALEEHFIDPAVQQALGAVASPLNAKLADFTSVRLREMDDTGIDVQVLSHAPPGLQRIAGLNATDIARQSNDMLCEVVARKPDRFAGFASLPTVDPQASACELERAVVDLGFKGAILHGLAGGTEFMDHRKYWPIYEAAQRLDVPIYLHPAEPHADVIARYYGPYAKTHPMLIRAAWGFTFETGTHAMRLILSGVFDAYPRLKIILGHLGETLPFLLARIDEALSRDTPMKNFREVFCSHFYVTTSGFFSDPAFHCCVQELGIDRVLFSVDWPYASNERAMQWLDRLELRKEEKEKVAYRNAEALLHL
jgi:2,3-dihydroxybenzoate decarboxylase